MREILFKGKRVDNGELVEGYLLKVKTLSSSSAKWVEKTLILIQQDEVYEVLPETVGQYTGLTDKNGKKIFEGDIVYEYNAYGERSYKKYVVRWEDVFVRWSIADCRGMYGSEAIAFYEVIGNIHDNPDLVTVI